MWDDNGEINLPKITIDGVDFDIEALSDEAKSQIQNIDFVNSEIQQKSNELQIAHTAKLTYLNALKREIEKKCVSNDH